MNRKVSVFILLILLASSFKYRAKSTESKAPAARQQLIASASESAPATSATSFEDFTVSIQKANHELVSGNPEPLKALWSKTSKATIAGNDQGQKWETVAVNMGKGAKGALPGNEYSYENITTQVGTDLACLIQTEHYRKTGEKPVDLHVTILCRKEKEGWKIVHRQAEPINLK